MAAGTSAATVVTAVGAWFGYHYIITMPSEFDEMRPTLEAQCLRQGGDNTRCACISTAFDGEARDDLLQWALRRGTFVTYQDYVDRMVPEYLERAQARCEA